MTGINWSISICYPLLGIYTKNWIPYHILLLLQYTCQFIKHIKWSAMINTSVFLYNVTTVFTDYFSTHTFHKVSQSEMVQVFLTMAPQNINWCSTLCLNVVVWSISICKWSVRTVCAAAYSTYIMWAQEGSMKTNCNPITIPCITKNLWFNQCLGYHTESELAGVRLFLKFIHSSNNWLKWCQSRDCIRMGIVSQFNKYDANLEDVHIFCILHWP